MSTDMLVMSDTHIGALGGLVPPRFQISGEPRADDESKHAAARRQYTAAVQRAMWNWAALNILRLRPKVLVLNGDIIDGRQRKSSGEGLWSTKIKDQADAAISVFRQFRRAGTKVYMIRGTVYHDGESGEEYIADALDAEIAEHPFLEINGVVFDLRHKEGGATAPAGRPALRNSMLSNLLWAAKEQQPVADVTIRSHLHSYYHEGDDRWLGIITPGYQWLSSYGQLEVNRPITVGSVYFSKIQKGDIQWQGLVARLPELKAQLWKI